MMALSLPGDWLACFLRNFSLIFASSRRIYCLSSYYFCSILNKIALQNSRNLSSHVYKNAVLRPIDLYC